jgi:hypothetical protein
MHQPVRLFRRSIVSHLSSASPFVTVDLSAVVEAWGPILVFECVAASGVLCLSKDDDSRFFSQLVRRLNTERYIC